MDDALNGMFDIICGDKEVALVPNIVHDDDNRAINELLGIEPPEVNIPIRPLMIEVYPFDPESNMLVADIREAFKGEKIFRETDIFTEPVITTITMEGFLSNVNCHEKDLIEDMDADEEFVRIKNNFGEKVYPGYVQPVKKKKSNRGRKKKPPKARKRKRQGTGECFNSQTTFVMPSPDTVVKGGIVPSDATIYKFKVFRTGKIQLPGLDDTMVIDNIITLIDRLIILLNFHLHTCENDALKLTRLINLNPVMKNYKFRVKKPDDTWIVDLAELRQMLKKHMTVTTNPKIFDIKYTRQEAKLSVRFSTPVHGNPKKCVRVNIFQSGKINILGGLKKDTTDAICDFLNTLFTENKNVLLTRLGSADSQLDDNIKNDKQLVYKVMSEFGAFPYPALNNEEVSDILKYAEDMYNVYIEGINKEIQFI